MQLKLGDFLEHRYRIEAPIARGGMSTVYRCVDTRLGRTVAAKVMDDQYVGDPIFSDRFQREARSMAQLSHPNLVGVYDFSSEGDNIFLIMELINGGTLRELLAEQGPLPAYAAVSVLRSILQGLAAVHAAGLIHRDLKPDNVLINSQNQVKLSDFGLVRAAAASNATSNQIIGTVSYLSPEQVSGDDITMASDVYSAGILLFELLTATTPFAGDSQISRAFARLDSDVPAPSSRVSGVPKLIDELVATATARNPEERFADAAEFLTALEDVARELDFPPYIVPVPKNTATQRAAAHVASLTDADATTVIGSVNDNADAPTTVVGNPNMTMQLPPSAPEETSVFPTAVPEMTPPPQPVVAQPHPDVDTPAVVESLSPAPVVTNRGRGGIVVWWIVVAIITTAIAIGAWWFGSGRYGEVPQVLGMDQTTASQTLANYGFGTAIATVYDDDIPVDLVAGTKPASGSQAVKGDDVTLLVSLGKPTVPDFAEQPDVSAYRAALSSRTLQYSEGESVYSDSVEEGKIAEVSPGVGSEVPVNSTITVHLSKGPTPVNVPNVRDQSREEAIGQLRNAGFDVTVETRFDDSVAGEHAIGTQPEAGSQIPKGSKITLHVSTATEIPDLFGLTEREARSLLAESGIRVAEVIRSEDSSAVGETASDVYESSPPSGTLIDSSQTAVTIVLVGEVEVPNVVGKRLSEARRILHDAGLEAKVATSASNSSRVLYQSPTIFSTLAPGEEVELRVLN